jgi:lipoate-protein ligase B
MILEVIDLGLIDFESADKYQKNILSQTKQQKRQNTLLLLRHEPVITIGRTGSRENILADSQVLLDKNIKIIPADRGGDVTFHGPGQLVAWPVFNLKYHKKDVHFFLRNLEQVIMNTLRELGIKSQTIPGKTGIWIGDKKIASIGIGISSWISFHGISLNVEPEDEYFSLIRPCGMDIKTTCIREQTDKDICFDDIKRLLVENFKNDQITALA